ncbi:hypothetical protein [uncultured Paraglaciecola sp.]|uniref:hypothetical protein n=1 Tax=uncultured Paraglaciecola sp. TaxID=1765024 RepID=UPI00261D5646|nr:hypothetical protein [uncultured Paraglaciecola sp.]
MGTRSVTYIHNGNRSAETICAIYRQMDGYPSAMGNELSEALGGKKLINGISGDYNSIMNGMGCAAAQLVAKLKTVPGSIYLQHPDCDGEDCNYHIYYDGDVYNPAPDARLSIDFLSGDCLIWSGLLSDFDGELIEATMDE